MSVAELNQRGSEALWRAMRATKTARNASAFARLLQEQVGSDTTPNYKTVIAWLDGATVPVWAVIAASAASGIPVEELLQS